MLLARYVRPKFGRVRLDRLQPLELQEFLAELTDRGLSARTVRYTHAVLRSALDQARRWKLLRENPAVDLALPRLERNEFRVLPPVEAQCFTALCLTEPRYLVFLVALTTGLRPSEYLALRVEDFDPYRSILTIRRTLERDGAKWRFAETKRPRSRRSVAVPAEVARLLSDLIANQGLRPAGCSLRAELMGRFTSATSCSASFGLLSSVPASHRSGSMICGILLLP